MNNKLESSELYLGDVKKLPEKISAVLLTTSRCMLDCFHCYNYPLEGDLSLKNHLKVLQNLYDIGVYRIVFTGGGVFDVIALDRITQRFPRAWCFKYS